MRTFALTLHYYSPKAYEYVRSVFDSNLPTERTLRAWYTSIDGSPGFTQCAIDVLRQKVEKAKENGKKLFVGLIFDEMFTRRQSEWNRSLKEFQGHVTSGKIEEYAQCAKLSKEALVIMVSGINEEFKIPIGYFLSAGLRGDEKAAILNEALSILCDIGIEVASITNDGAASNFAAMRILGVKYNEDKPYFENPFKKESNIYSILDVPHTHKNIRNCLGRHKVLYDSSDSKIMWDFIFKLVLLQNSLNINLCNKLTKTHIEYDNKKMNVRVAAETISNSVASAIEFLDKVMKLQDFSNTEATVGYLRTFKNLFKIMNTKLNHTDGKYKRPISEQNINEFKEYFNHAKEYIKGLYVIENGKKNPLLKSKSYVPFFGAYHNMTSFIGIYEEHLKNNNIDEFYTFSVSQDHVESFFGCIRRMGGPNCNPNATQFAAAYRKLIVHNEVTSSDAANCENDVTKILQVSSSSKNTKSSADAVELAMLSIYDDENVENQIDADENNVDESLQQLNNHSTAYLASILEAGVIHTIQQKGSKRCPQCMNVFVENNMANDVFIAFLSQSNEIRQPCISTIDLIQTMEKLLKRYDSHDVTFNSIITHIPKVTDVSSFYELSEFEGEHDHKRDLIKMMIEEYFDMKSEYMSKLMTRMSQKKLLRHDKLKEIHRAGQ